MAVERSDCMNMNSPVYKELNKAWKATCRVLLGEEVGELKEYEEWLKEYVPVIGKRKSHISGKDVTVAFDEYCKDARFVSLDEVKEKSIEPLTINEIKDIDSIVEAISEKWECTGNVILGNSGFVESSSSVTNSFYVSDSTYVDNSKYVAHCEHLTGGSYYFGCSNCGQNDFVLKFVRGVKNKRIFNSSHCHLSSDIYCSTGLTASHEMMFSFHQYNKNHMIGNLQLSKDKYFSLKQKLIEEIRENLKKDKSFPSIFKFVENEKPNIDIKIKSKTEKKEDISFVDKDFMSTFKVLFKKEPESIKRYENWLSKHTAPMEEIKTVFGSAVQIQKPYHMGYAFSLIPQKRVVSQEESLQLSGLQAKENEIETLEKVMKWFSDTCCFNVEYISGKNNFYSQCPVIADSSFAHNVYVIVNSEHSAISSWVLWGSRYIFGSVRTTNSSHCINAYNSLNLTRCFEVDSSTNCSDTYFAHNCEGLQDAMFCWNAKGKRYAIGNAELPPDQYRKIKDMLVEQMADEILKKKELKYDIFNLPCLARGES